MPRERPGSVGEHDGLLEPVETLRRGRLQEAIELRPAVLLPSVLFRRIRSPGHPLVLPLRDRIQAPFFHLRSSEIGTRRWLPVRDKAAHVRPV